MRSEPMIESPLLTAMASVRHGFFTRAGGVSSGIYASLNCGYGSGDERKRVAENRTRAAARLGLEAVLTAYQIHGVAVAEIDRPWSAGEGPKADAMVTRRPGLALGILTADCAPVLLADASAGIVAAAHAGWKGAKAGVIEAVVGAMIRLGADPANIVAVVGPAIGQDSYEVGGEFRAAFLKDDAAAGRFFVQPEGGQPHFDLSGFVAARLEALKLGAVERIAADTYAEPDRFFSYRRSCHLSEPDYGRQLSAIALA
jgi:hypothetical protein